MIAPATRPFLHAAAGFAVFGSAATMAGTSAKPYPSDTSAFTYSGHPLGTPVFKIGQHSLQSRKTARLDWEFAIDELLRLRNLPDDWDGEGSQAPDQVLIDVAIRFALDLRETVGPPGRVHIGVNGTIYFEWYSSQGYMEIEVESPTLIECRWLKQGSTEAEVFRTALD